MKKPLVGLIGFGLITTSTAGCHTCCREPVRPGGTVVVPQPLPPGPPPAVAAPTPCPPVAAAPVPAWPGTPPAAPPPPSQRYYGPTTPAAPDVRLAPPEITTPEPPLARLEPMKPAVEESGTKPPATTEKPPTPPLPVGIPQFAYAGDRVATGLKPLLDGLDWLEASNFRTVLHVRAPGEDDTAERRLVEKHGLKFVSLEVSPQKLDRQTVEAFSSLVSDRSALPLFVYDREGALAGGLWYLHFRMAEKLDDAEARQCAGRLGFKAEGDGEHKTMWLAIQKYLSQQ